MFQASYDSQKINFKQYGVTNHQSDYLQNNHLRHSVRMTIKQIMLVNDENKILSVRILTTIQSLQSSKLNIYLKQSMFIINQNEV